MHWVNTINGVSRIHIEDTYGSLACTLGSGLSPATAGSRSWGLKQAVLLFLTTQSVSGAPPKVPNTSCQIGAPRSRNKKSLGALDTWSDDAIFEEAEKLARRGQKRTDPGLARYGGAGQPHHSGPC